ncbi:MAG: hypothetical protein IT431_06405 [Phycisphaerales bacterium]|nr:hypothetical protein [Phycisphaerales bacterium]
MPRLALAILLLCLGACARREPAPAGQTQPRIVVLSPALAVILTDMGLAPEIVGRHGWDRVLDPAIPVCGEQQAINYEALHRARPTHVLTEWGSRELPARLTGTAQRDGFMLRDFRLLTLADIDKAAGALAEMFPHADADDGIARFHALVASPAPEPVWTGRVLLLMGVSPITALGPGSAHHELLERAGGVPALTEGSPYMTLHAEDVLRLAPDAIVLIRTGNAEAHADPLDALGPAIRGLDIPAVADRRVALLDDPLALIPSTRLGALADELRRTLGEWADR